MKIEDILNNTQNAECFAIILRHSIREEIKDATKSQDQLLTEEGKRLARQFGSNLPKIRKVRLFHSHVKRCYETALHIQDGYGDIVEIISYDSLTGFYILEPDIIPQDVNKIGSYNFISKWINKSYPENFIMDFYLARQKLINSIIENYDSNYLDIYISHDWNIVLLLSYFQNLESQKYNWPNFMEGICFNKEKDKIKMFCNLSEVKEI